MNASGLAGALLAGLVGLTGLSACGVIGPPMPPEDVGLAAKLNEERDKSRKTQKPGEEAPSDEVVLPPVRPIGTSAGSQADESQIDPQR